MEGLEIPADVVTLAPAPLPPAPAHELQLCHPDIFWMPDFTVCAPAEGLAKNADIRAANAAIKMEQYFVGIELHSRGFLL